LATIETSALSLAKRTYDDLFWLIRTRLHLLLLLALASLVPPAGGLLLGGVATNPVALTVGSFLVEAAGLFVAAPMIVAIFGSLASRWTDAWDEPAISYSSRATHVYWAWSLVLVLVGFIFSWTQAGLAALGFEAVATFVMCVMAVAVIGIGIRLLTIFPMAALTPDDVSIRKALGQTSGNFGKILGASLLLALPFLLLIIALVITGMLLDFMIENVSTAAVSAFLFVLVLTPLITALATSLEANFFFAVTEKNTR